MNRHLIFALSTAILCIAGWCGLVFWLGPHYFHQFQSDPSLPFAGRLPEGLRPLAAYATPEGYIGEYLIASVPQKLSIVIAPHRSDGAEPTFTEFLDAIDAYRNQKTSSQHFAPLTLKYGAAHFDLRRGLEKVSGEVTIGDQRVPSLRFTEKGVRWYEVAFAAPQANQILVMAFRKEAAVDSSELNRILALLSPVGSSPTK